MVFPIIFLTLFSFFSQQEVLLPLVDRAVIQWHRCRAVSLCSDSFLHWKALQHDVPSTRRYCQCAVAKSENSFLKCVFNIDHTGALLILISCKCLLDWGVERRDLMPKHLQLDIWEVVLKGNVEENGGLVTCSMQTTYHIGTFCRCSCVSIACFSVCLGLVWLLGRLDLNSGCVFGLTIGV